MRSVISERKGKNCCTIDKMIFMIFILIFRVLIDISYELIIVPYFGYSGFSNNKKVIFVIISYLILCCFANVAYIWKKNNDRISKEVLYLLFLISVVPFTTMISFGNLSIEFIIANTMFWCLLSLYYIYLPYTRIKWAVGHRCWGLSQKTEDGLLISFLIISLLVIIYISWKYTRFRINLDLLNVYALRAEARSYRLSTVLRYLFSWSRAVNTVLIAYYYRRKKYLLTGVAFFLQILSFGIDGSKSVFFYAVCALIVSVFPKINLSKINDYVVLFLSGVTLVGIGHYLFTGNYVIVSLFVRRLMILPVQLGQNYFDFFTEYAPDFYHGSFLKYLGFKTSYPNLAYIIGEKFYDSPNMGANNGLISDAIANMGIVGIVIEPLFIIWMLRILDNSSKGLDVRIYVTTALYTSIVLLNSFIPVVLMTHGILVTIIILKMMKRTIEIRNCEEESYE